MNKNHILTIASLLLFMVASITTKAAIAVPGTEQTSSAPKTDDPRIQQLMQRLHEIKAMNKSELTRTEKRSLRKEVLQTKKEMKAISGGVYLSVGAIIIIILLLILIL